MGMSTRTPARHPAGSPTGGQFAPVSHAESNVDLDEYEDAVFSGRESVEAYDGLIIAALWSSVDVETREPFDAANYTADDIATETAARLREEFDDFLEANNATIARIREKHPRCTPAQVGHDFWLTRNRHGAGFWDRAMATSCPGPRRCTGRSISTSAMRGCCTSAEPSRTFPTTPAARWDRGSPSGSGYGCGCAPAAARIGVA